VVCILSPEATEDFHHRVGTGIECYGELPITGRRVVGCLRDNVDAPAIADAEVANNTNESVPALFTTIMFLDFGKNSANAIDGYVYAYGFDNDWRDQQMVYLARVPKSIALSTQVLKAQCN
jgi:hypothetical protein